MVKRSLNVPGVKITAICDIDEGHATQAQILVEKATGIRPKFPPVHVALSALLGGKKAKAVEPPGDLGDLMHLFPQARAHG